MNLPNKLTVVRLGLTAVFVAAMLLPAEGIIRTVIPLGKTVALALFILASLTDWLDGWIARRHRLETTFGMLLDPLADKVLVVAAFICLIEQPAVRHQPTYGPLVQGWMVLLIVAREFLVTGMRLVAREKGTVLRAERLGKHKTAVQMLTIIVLLAGLAAREDWNCLGWDCQQFDVAFARLALGLMIVVVALTVWSGVAYLVKNRHLVLEHA